MIENLSPRVAAIGCFKESLWTGITKIDEPTICRRDEFHVCDISELWIAQISPLTSGLVVHNKKKTAAK
jgi:hypothetical protein